MAELKKFIDIIANEFHEDRLTYQKSVPTFHPESAEEAGRLFALANKSKQKIYINGYGNNISPVGDPFENCLVVKSDRLNGLIEIIPGDYYVVVGSGYPLRELNQALKEYELFLPHADLPYVGSIGGAVAIGLRADYQGHDLPISKYFIGAKIVDPQGKIISPGSVCFKSVSGLDIVRIYSPSWGMLGMIVSVTFRVMPISGREDYGNITMKSIDFEKFKSLYRNPEDNVSALYSLKIKSKFDPNGILPFLPL